MSTFSTLLGRIRNALDATLTAILEDLSTGNADRDLVANDVTVANISGPRFKITEEGGYATRLLNGTGTTSVKGSVVSASTSADLTFISQANEYDAFGVVYESGVAAGEETWVVVAGQADVLVENSHAMVHGELALCSATDGRATSTTNPGSGLPAVDIHFKEIGHVLQSKDAGTNVLCRCMLHFN